MHHRQYRIGSKHMASLAWAFLSTRSALTLNELETIGGLGGTEYML